MGTGWGRAIALDAPQMGFINVKNEENIVDRIVQYVQQFLSEEEGVTAIEYGLIAALIAVMLIGGASAIGDNLLSTFTSIAGRLTGGA